MGYGRTAREICRCEKQRSGFQLSLYEKLVNQEEVLSVIGLGYVGMPIAVAFAKQIRVIGFDLNKEKIALYRQGVDPTHTILKYD